ncbi:MAG: HAMP domain-containing histidine kinase [Actinomycetota bacterium]|nr:HAMP domain-containing histidine kinase [Actinomycetota bacterium]
MSVAPNSKANKQWIRTHLQELADMLVERPGGEAGLPARTGVSVERTAQVAGLQALVLPIVTAPLLLAVEPTGPLGDAGWAVAFGALAAVVAIGAALVRAPSVSVRVLAASNVFTASVLAMLAWLTGGFDSPFPILFPLLASSITPHRPRIRRLLIAWVLVGVASPLLYESSVTSRDAAELTMIGAASVATLLTMVWLSSRVSRSEVGLMAAISSAKIMQQELEAEAGRLLEINEERERLVTRVSHEFRTPLTSVKGYVEALMGGEAGDLDPAQRELAAVALRNTVRLESLIADVLLLSRVEAGQLELRPERLDMRPMLEGLAQDLLQVTREAGVSLIVEVEPGLEWDADRERLEQALTNLLSNAIKYSPEGGPVLVRAKQSGSELWIEVLDKGVGVPQDEIGRLGERFFRASTAGSAPGTGLGISITQELVDLHHGELDISSEVGSGSIFRIRLPAGRT